MPATDQPLDRTDSVTGAILGCAVGDAVGLPYEGLPAPRARRLLGEPDRHRFLFGRGMVSDDTEHTCMVAAALCEAPRDPELFARRFAGRLRWWLLGLPAGVGAATLRACVRLWLGFPPSRSGVWSAGNGPSMRSSVMGAAIDDVGLLRRLVAASTRVTHADPAALHGAWAVAMSAWCARRGIVAPADWRGTLRRNTADPLDGGTATALPAGDRQPGNPDEVPSTTAGGPALAPGEELLDRVAGSVSAGEPVEAFAEALGCGGRVSGWTWRTVPVALHAWLSRPRDLRAAVEGAIRCGGDTDTTAAIAGALAGCGIGRAGVPAGLRDGLLEWPRSVRWMERLAAATARAAGSGTAESPPRVVPGAGLLRNAGFLAVVLGHALRRLLPPY